MDQAWLKLVEIKVLMLSQCLALMGKKSSLPLTEIIKALGIPIYL
jgi:hypothetical protein